MKKNKTTIIMVLFFFMGLSVLLYPTISSFYNKRVQSRAIVDYESILNNYDEGKYEEIFNEAKEYNDKLKQLESPFSTYNTISNYEDTLKIDDTGMMGYLTIDKIKVELPIYHGTSSKVLSRAVGHLEGSSLPIGGIGTHSVLSAHRGLPSSTLFTDLDRLEIGDIFVITILNEELTYEIDNIVIVNPDEVENLKVDDNEDYVTLVTCTPYGINTHRLLVRGKRIENVKEKTYITTEAYKINSLIVIPLIAIPIILIILLLIIFKPIDNNKKKLEEYLNLTEKKVQEKSMEVKVMKRINYILIFIMLFMSGSSVLADTNDNIVDFSKKGSISITLNENEENTKVVGAEITIYKVADAITEDSNLKFSYDESLSSWEEDLDNGNITDEILETITKNEFINFNGITNELGIVTFDNLDLGLYLIIQTNQVEGYSKIDPFLVMIPQIQDNGWIYDVSAEPKVDIIRLFDLVVEKVWNVSTDVNTPDNVVIELLKGTEVIDTITLNSENNWTYTWKQIEMSDDYSVREKEVPTGYTVTYRNDGNKFIVTNTKSLVQTGRSVWTTPILASIGLLFVVIGVVLEKRKKYE